jgi:hypothetical protein
VDLIIKYKNLNNLELNLEVILKLPITYKICEETRGEEFESTQGWEVANSIATAWLEIAYACIFWSVIEPVVWGK